MRIVTIPVPGRFPLRPAAALLALGVVLAGCQGTEQGQQVQAQSQQLTEQNRILTADKQRLADELKAATDADNESSAVLAEVQTGLEEIRAKELHILKKTLDVSEEGKTPTRARERLSAEIATIRTSIHQNLQKLAHLERERKATGQKMAALQAFADELKRSLEEKETAIAALDAKVRDLTSRVEMQASVIGEKDGQLKEKEETLQEKTKALNTGYVAVAGKKALRSKGVIDKRGSILGLGGAWQETGKYDPAVFHEIDTAEQDEVKIPAPATKVRVLPGHPEKSYEIVAGGPGTSTLKVTDRDAFWRESRYLVVMIPD